MFLVRIGFVIWYGGMDAPNLQASPMAFLIGSVFEQLFFTLPALVIIKAIRSNNPESA